MEVGGLVRGAAQALGLGDKQDIAFSFWCAAVDEERTAPLLVSRFAVEEVIFGLPQIEIELVSKYADIELDKLIDQPASLTIHHKYLDELRHFSGIVVEAGQGNSSYHRTSYRLLLQPALCRLDYGSDCRIFQGKTVPEIVELILGEHDVEDVVWQVGQEHEPREYCVQYRETHLGFIERILAEEGIFYYFRHAKQGKCELIISDNPYHVSDCHGQKQLDYNAQSGGVHYGVYCSSIERLRKLRSTSYRQRDYSFKHPAYPQEHQSTAQSGDYVLYDYPGRYKRSHVGEPFTRNRLEAARVDSDLVHGLANAPLLVAGHGVELVEHPDQGLNCQWRLLTIRHEGTQPQALEEEGQAEAADKAGKIAAPPIKGADLVGFSYGTSRSSSASSRASLLRDDAATVPDSCHYACAFTAQKATQPYRPPQMRKPLVDGPQMAHVVGPEGEEIYTDEFGRVKVHFPWDWRQDPKAEDSSCWIRVASSWAGALYGAISIPRVGHEVIVEFLEGDPDQPIIIGRTYHARNQPPYKLPDHKTKMVIRSDTHKQGRNSQKFNELSFEDENGQEEIFIHAERDMNVEVENDSTEWIGNDKGVHIAGHHYTEVNQARHEKIARSIITENGGDRIDYIGKISALLPFPERYHLKANGLIGRLKLYDIGGIGNWQSFVSGNRLANVVLDSVETVGGSKSIFSNNNILASAKTTINLNAGKDVIVKSNEMTIIQCGNSSIVLKENGQIFLVGREIFLASDMTEIKGAEIVKISGKLIKLNQGE